MSETTIKPVARPGSDRRRLTTDQARTKDLERRGFHNAEVRSDGLRAVVECDVTDLDALLDLYRRASGLD